MSIECGSAAGVVPGSRVSVEFRQAEVLGYIQALMRAGWRPIERVDVYESATMRRYLPHAWQRVFARCSEASDTWLEVVASIGLAIMFVTLIVVLIAGVAAPFTDAVGEFYRQHTWSRWLYLAGAIGAVITFTVLEYGDVITDFLKDISRWRNVPYSDLPYLVGDNARSWEETDWCSFGLRNAPWVMVYATGSSIAPRRFIARVCIMPQTGMALNRYFLYDGS